MTQILINDDCLDYLQTIPPGSVDCLVTDPPYGYSFMGKNWDKAVPSVEVWKECLRVLKPGAFAFVMSAPRQDVLSQMIVRLTDAGFKTDFTSIYWTYASGFPKAMNIGKMVDKRGGVSVSWFGEWLKDWRKKSGIAQKDIAALFPSKTGGLTGCAANWELGLNIPTPEQFTKICRHFNLPFESIEAAEREVIGKNPNGFGRNTGSSLTHDLEAHPDLTTPKTDAAKALDGSYGGFQPKPAVEVILVAMKPLSEKTYVDQALKNGKGVTWLDDCRIPTCGEASENDKICSCQEQPIQSNAVSAEGSASADRPPSKSSVPASVAMPESVRTLGTPQDDTSKKDTSCSVETSEGNISTSSSTSGSGNGSTDQSREEPSSTTRTKTSKTTDSGTLNSCPVHSTVAFTTPRGGSSGRFMANLLVSDDVLNDGTTSKGVRSVRSKPGGARFSGTYNGGKIETQKQELVGVSADQGGYSRFFSLDAWAEKTLPFLVTAKASKREKNEGLEGFEEKVGAATYGEYAGTEEHTTNTTNTTNTTKNTHACVKPLTLMSYLITLGSRPGDTVLDPFLGSGTTALAAKSLNRGYIGIEKDASYYEIAKARLNKP